MALGGGYLELRPVVPRVGLRDPAVKASGPLSVEKPRSTRIALNGTFPGIGVIPSQHIRRNLGGGGLGVGYKAQKLELDGLVALKLLPLNLVPS